MRRRSYGTISGILSQTLQINNVYAAIASHGHIHFWMSVSFLSERDETYKIKLEISLRTNQFNFQQILNLMSVRGPINLIQATTYAHTPLPPYYTLTRWSHTRSFGRHVSIL